MTTVWEDLIGQAPVVETLKRATAAAHDRLNGGSGKGMTHAWLFTGPPGSGRSNAARAFAAALQADLGDDTVPQALHPDVTVIATDRLSLGVDEIRDLVRKASLSPSQGKWQVLIIEDADRLTDSAADALLKTLEEPPPRTVWMLCAPTAEDVIVTIRSRSRQVVLRTPPATEVAAMLVARHGISEALADSAARASQGHIGRARALALKEDVRARRSQILALPTTLRTLGDCLAAAAALDATAKANATNVGDDLDGDELAKLREGWGVQERGKRPPGYAGALSALEKDQKRRRTRIAHDSIDGVLIELISFYRDVLAMQTAPTAELINVDVEASIRELAESGTPESTLRRIDAIAACREAILANAASLLALEHMMIGLRV
ncbi:MAG: polymerase subunit delta [Nocardioidaceae bacterium]|nr:polymerase subunit delta [Nocardioidaceae bacterium]